MTAKQPNLAGKTPSTMPSFECLYYLENIYLLIIEIKRSDLAENAGKNQKFKWLKIDKENLDITTLHFISMDSSGEIEERYFEQGYLKFNATIGTFIEKYNSAQHPLGRRMDCSLTNTLQNTVADFLKADR